MATISTVSRRLWSWLTSFEIITSILDLTGIGKWIIGGLGGIALGAWGVIDQLPASVIALMGLVGFTGTIWAVNGLQWWRTAASSAVTFLPTATVEVTPPQELSLVAAAGPYLRGFSIRLADLARDDNIIRERTFDDCHIYGPAVVVFLVSGMVHRCAIDSSFERTVMPFTEERGIAGVIGLQNCVFRRCHFHRVSFIVTPANYARLREDFLRSHPEAQPNT